MQKHPIIALVGTSGSGKTSLLLEMIKRFPGLCRAVMSNTTRPRRGPEDDVFYHFLSEEEFSTRDAQGDFFQSVRFGGYRYGCDREETDTLVNNFIGLVVLIQEGVQQFRAAGYNTHAIRIVPQGHTPRTEELRKRDDAAREHVDVGFSATIMNNFSPGGFGRAADDLARYIENLKKV